MNLTDEYARSRFVRIIENGEGKLIYHSLLGNPTIIDEGAKEILKIFLQPQSIDSFLTDYELDNESKEALTQLVTNGFLVHPCEDTRESFFNKVGEKIHNATGGKELRVLDLSVSELCNFGCSYIVSIHVL